MKHFTMNEFASPDLPESGERMQWNFLDTLEEARFLAKVPFKITSGYRTITHNKKVGGSETSSHLKGIAVDISCTDSASREKILYGLISAGFVRIGIAKTFIHVDLDTNKPDAIWLY